MATAAQPDVGAALAAQHASKVLAGKTAIVTGANSGIGAAAVTAASRACHASRMR
jgi:short-subunit dehydrogenase